MNAVACLAGSGVVGVSTTGSEYPIALVGLAGVIVGGIITGGFSYWIAWRKERADAAAKARKEDAMARRAARLIDVDLLSAEVAARTCVEDRKWWSNMMPLSTDTWQQHRDVLASKLSLADWFALITAVQSVTVLQIARDGALAIQMAELATDAATADMFAAAERLNIDVADPSPAIPEDGAVLSTIEQMLPRVVAGRAALAPLMQYVGPRASPGPAPWTVLQGLIAKGGGVRPFPISTAAGAHHLNPILIGSGSPQRPERGSHVLGCFGRCSDRVRHRGGYGSCAEQRFYAPSTVARLS